MAQPTHQDPSTLRFQLSLAFSPTPPPTSRGICSVLAGHDALPCPSFCFCVRPGPCLLVLAVRDRCIWNRDTGSLNLYLRSRPVTLHSSQCPDAGPCFRQGCSWNASFTRVCFWAFFRPCRCREHSVLPVCFALVSMPAAGACFLLLRTLACAIS